MDGRLTDATLLSALRIISGVLVIVAAGGVAKAALRDHRDTSPVWWRVLGGFIVALAMIVVASSIFTGYLRLGL